MEKSTVSGPTGLTGEEEELPPWEADESDPTFSAGAPQAAAESMNSKTRNAVAVFRIIFCIVLSPFNFFSP